MPAFSFHLLECEHMHHSQKHVDARSWVSLSSRLQTGLIFQCFRWTSILQIDCCGHSFCPKTVRQFGISQHRAHSLDKCPVHALSNTILLWCLWNRALMAYPLRLQVVTELRRYIFTAIVSTKGFELSATAIFN